jgi:hypothetical protein
MEVRVKRLTMLVTPEGKWVFPNTAEFFEAVGDPAPDYDAVAFAVKNLGFIKWQMIEQSIIEIELHPRSVGLAALLSAQQQLLVAPVRLFRIRYFETAWESEISASLEHTIRRLSELCAPVFTPVATERYTSEPMDLSTLFEDGDHQFRVLAQKWRVSFGNFDPSVITIAAQQQLLPRMAVVGVKPSRREPVFRFIGYGHKWVGQNYHMMGVGEKVANQPDKEYGEWVSGFYNLVAASGQPRYDVVTAQLRYEDEQNRPRRSVRYERLLLPWKTPSDEVFVTLCSATIDSSAGARPAKFGSESSVAKKVANSA